MNLLHQPTKMTIEQFGAWLQGQERKHELVRGVPRMLPYVKLNHNRIVTNLAGLLYNSLDKKKFEHATGDFAVKTGPDSIRFADVMVLPAGKSGNILSVEDAEVIFEVLSNSSVHEDFGDKRQEYQGLESLKAYVVLAQDEPQIWLWQRDKKGKWPADPAQLSDGSLKLVAIGVEIPVAEIYRGVRP